VSRLTVRSFLALIASCAALAVPAGADAATVVNGDFETGGLGGWQVHNSFSECGNWFAYNGSVTPATGFPFFAPPQGSSAAVTDEHCADTAILYQDVALEPFWSHSLSVNVYYHSREPIFVPSPNTLEVSNEPVLVSIGEEPPPVNQQMRVDVLKPTAPIESLDPADILATLFANKNGDPEQMTPTIFTADLTPFAGQTVRLRAAVAAGDYYFYGAIDAASITSVPPNSAITRGKLTLNKSKGTGKLAISVPGPGTLTEVGKGKTKKVKRASLTATAAGTVKLPLNPNAAGKKVLNSNGKLKTGIDVTFTPTGGAAATQTYKVTLKKNLKK
jgi:hypothetical protein